MDQDTVPNTIAIRNTAMSAQKALKKFVVEGGWCGRVIIVSALSLSLRDKDRLRVRGSLTKMV